MFKALIKSRLSALLSMFFRSSRSSRKRSPAFKILIGIFVVYILVVFIGLFVGLFTSMTPLAGVGLGWLYFAMAAIIAFGLSFIGSVFTAQQQIYSAEDNDLLLSMPIPPSYIIGSRIIMLLILNFLFEAIVVIPAGVVWCLFLPVNPAGIIMYILCCLALPFLSITFSCILGWLITVITNRIKNKSIITVAISVIFLALYFYFFSNIGSYLEVILNSGAQIAGAIKSAVLPAWAFGIASANGSIAGLLIFLGCSAIPFAIVWFVLSKSFIRLSTGNRGLKKVKYREKALAVSTSGSALFKKELKHFLTNGMYILNAALGSIFIIVGAVILIIYHGYPQTLAEQLPFIKPFFGPVAALILCFIASTNLVSASSVSLEGKNLWITRSMPVSTLKILMSKVKLHVVVTLPAVVFGAVVLIITLNLPALDALSVLISAVVFPVFFAFIGIVINLHFPKMDFINEVAVVKQSSSIILAMLASMGCVVVPAIACIWASVFIPINAAILCVCAILASLCLLMYKYLKSGGSARYEQI